MKQWLRWIGGAVLMGVIWAAVWTAVGAIVGGFDPNGRRDEVWLGPAIGMQPGFLGGVICSVLIAIVANRRRLAELSILKVVACGGAAGLLVGLLPFAINKPPGEVALWLVAAVVIGSMTVLGAVSAAGSLALARTARAARR